MLSEPKYKTQFQISMLDCDFKLGNLKFRFLKNVQDSVWVKFVQTLPSLVNARHGVMKKSGRPPNKCHINFHNTAIVLHS